VADFPGTRNWGYDGVLPFAPDSRYGRPDDLKALIQEAHALGLSVFLDVVYNHFGPQGNWLHRYAPGFFTERHQTPWGAGINFDGAGSRTVRDFFIHNAIYWLREYHLDGLRLDAVHAIADDSRPDILIELADAVHGALASEPHRQVHLVLENDRNAARYLERRADGRPRWYSAQWNDDSHHALHLLVTGERDGYYGDYAQAPAAHLGRCLTEGFAYQGEPSAYRHGARRGESTHGLPPTAFIDLIQNHDQIGNRAFGERIHALAAPQAVTAALAILLLAPSPPLLFMGQEWAASCPFLYFCDFDAELGRAVTEGRRRELARREHFADPAALALIPDPNDPETFLRSRLDWGEPALPAHASWLDLHRRLLELRRREIVPRLSGMGSGGASYRLVGAPPDPRGLLVQWRLGDGSRLCLAANLDDRPLADPGLPPSIAARPLYLTPADLGPGLAAGGLPPWSVAWHLDAGGAGAGSGPG
jgi:malto-oligosyltrehalose trehalohydrolase